MQLPEIDRSIHPDDEMRVHSSDQHYFSVGESALAIVRDVISMQRRDPRTIRRILDLPCGHGRVLRWLRSEFREAELTACDLNRSGVEYCAKAFDAKPVQSDRNPYRIPLSGEYDLIWCGSLLTHLDEGYWTAFLEKFAQHLAPGGLVLVSVQGQLSAKWIQTGHYDYGLAVRSRRRLLRSFRRHGFAYADYADGSGYGITLAKPAWVCGRLERLPQLNLVHYAEATWDNHHDIFVCRRADICDKANG